LLERDADLGRLHTLLSDAQAGRGRVAFVTGEPGIGKTSILNELVNAACGVRVAIGRCDALATPRALGPFADAARALGIEVAPDRDRLLTQLVDELRDGPPTLLVIEDAHWADEATVEVLGMLGRRTPDLPLLLAVSYRDTVIGTGHPLVVVVGDLITAATTALVVLGPLSHTGVDELVARAGMSGQVSTHALYERTGGNPFFVTEALAAPGDDVPTTVRLAVLARAARLDRGARDVIDAIAIVPGHAERWLVDGICGCDDRSLDECVAAGMLVHGPDGYAFRHELARMAIWAEMPETTRRTLHATALAVLADQGGVDPARLAHHAGAAGDETAIAMWSRIACREALARTAFREAVRHGEAALAFAPRLTPDHLAELRVDLARALVALVRFDDAYEHVRQAVDHWRRAGNERREADALVAMSAVMSALGRTEDSMQPIARAIELLERQPPGTELAQAYIRMTSAHMLARQRDAAAAWGAKAIALTTELADPTLKGRALIEAGIADVMDGRFEGLRLVNQAIDLGRTHRLPGLVAAGLMQIGSGCGEMRRYDLAVPACVEGVDVARTHHIETNRRYTQAWLARCRFDLGEWDDAERQAHDALAGRASPITRFVALNTAGWLRARRGDGDVWPLLDEALAIARQIAHLQRIWPSAVARAEAGWLEGSIADHVPLLEEVAELAGRCGHGIALGEIGLWLQRAGVVQAPLDGAAEPFASWVAGSPLAAAAQFRRMGCPYETASALVDAGDAASLQEAWATFDRLGAAPMKKRVALALSERGVHVGAQADGAPAPDGDSSGLTKRELDVLRLVSAGFSNPQIAAALYISRKTTEHHVSNILAKLRLANRTEAAAAAVRLGLVEG
jgi:DNA-binding CsgD family transcriptional regulator/tetratricopeptide (TPR) repeat protein